MNNQKGKDLWDPPPQKVNSLKPCFTLLNLFETPIPQKYLSIKFPNFLTFKSSHVYCVYP